MLLFLIGLELNPKKLIQMRGPILGLGGAQVFVSTVVIAVVANLFGATWQTSIVIGMGLALSSTAIALKVIEEQGLAGGETGQSGFAVLLFQDIAVIPMLAVLPVLAGNTAGNWLMRYGCWLVLVGYLLEGTFTSSIVQICGAKWCQRIVYRGGTAACYRYSTTDAKAWFVDGFRYVFSGCAAC